MKLMQKCFEEGTHRIYAMCDPANPNSWKLLERLGFIRKHIFLRMFIFGKMPVENQSGKIPIFMRCWKEPGNEERVTKGEKDHSG